MCPQSALTSSKSRGAASRTPADGVISHASRGFAFRAAAAIGLALGFVGVFSVFATPRQIAQHQIENDKVIGAPTSNTGKALADLKRRDGVKTSHQLHQEQSGSSILGTK